MPERDSLSPEQVVSNIGNLAKVAASSGVAAIVFALPTVIGGFGVYFLSIAIHDAQVSGAKVSIGMFATFLGTGLSILLLYLFTTMNLWDKLGLSKLSKDQQAILSALQARVKALEERSVEASKALGAA